MRRNFWTRTSGWVVVCCLPMLLAGLTGCPELDIDPQDLLPDGDPQTVQTDTDDDGVGDDLDLCPDTTEGAEVDADGCSSSQRDSDGDGVVDADDDCPDTPADAEIDAAGCAVGQPDIDGDGVNDESDLCPDTAEGADVDADGCAPNQRDSDGDGVVDADDHCPGTPVGSNVDAVGCATAEPDPDLDPEDDADGDGVSDESDQCPDTAADDEVDADGCSSNQRDSDGDGVVDADDDCPSTAVGSEADAAGCATNQLDSDGDGVNDADDACPNTTAGTTVNATGCPVVVIPPGPTGQSWSVVGDVFFAGSLEPSRYDMTDDGTLTEASIGVSAQLAGDPDTTVFTDIVPLMVPTTIANATIEAGSIPVNFSVLYELFVVNFAADDSVTWNFELTIETELTLSGFETTSSVKYLGTQLGTLSEDGTTVTWTSISGTRTISLRLDGNVDEGQQSEDPLEEAFAGVSLGSWTAID